jgi:hypothetical protein
VADHAVLRADGEALQVPAADHGLPGRRLGEAAVVRARLGHPGELGGGGDVADQDAAGAQRAGHGVRAVPGREQVEDDAVDVGLVERLRDVADREMPGRVRAAEVGKGNGSKGG